MADEAALPPAIVVDLDGTLALLTKRGPFEYLKCHLDVVNEPVRRVVVAYRACFGKVVIISGREDISLDMTREWLRQHEVPYDAVFLRARGDRRKDVVVKREIYEREIKGRYRVDFVLEDRDQVVAMWRDQLGMTCFHVAWGKF